MAKQGYIAFDLGAESGRAMLAIFENDRIELQESYRFANSPQRLPSGYHWNLLDLWANIVQGLRVCNELAKKNNIELVSLGVCAWGVDFALVGRSGQVLSLPYSYRDTRCQAGYDKAIANLGQKEIYEVTGIQFMPINTLYQLVAQYDAEPHTVTEAKHLLTMSDLMHFFLSGKAINEATNTSTTQMIDVHTGDWARDMISQLGLPTNMLGPIVPAATKIGKLRKEVANEAGTEQIDVIVPGSHDTASAVAAVPVDPNRKPTEWAYISSGTWSLMGAEIDQPIITEASRQLSFTHELGVENKIRFLKNIAGLWLVQQCRDDLARSGEVYDYTALTELAADAKPMRTLVDPDHQPFATPGDICAKISQFADSTGQPAPQTPGQFVRCCLESLALCYRRTFQDLEQLLDSRIQVLHIVGGGGKNTLLNQMTADATGRTVIVGPYEATAIGNALTQAIGAGHVKDLPRLRQIVRKSFETIEVEPVNRGVYGSAAERFESILGK